MDQIFNELSACGDYENEHHSREGMIQLIAVTTALINMGMNPSIRTTSDVSSRELAREYTIGKWAVDSRVDPDLRRYFLAQATKSPYVEILLGGEENQDEISEFRFNEIVAQGFGLAFIWDAPSISLGADSHFGSDPIKIIKRSIADGNNLTDVEVDVCCLSNTDQVENRREWVRARLQNTLTSGSDIVSSKSQYFPHLSFCDHSIGQLLLITGSEQYFPEMVRHLFTLEETMVEYERGSFEPAVNFSVDTPNTLSRYNESRTFICEDGEERLFSLHTKLFSVNKRIYYYPIPSAKLVYIGYIGDHLPTQKY